MAIQNTTRASIEALKMALSGELDVVVPWYRGSEKGDWLLEDLARIDPRLVTFSEGTPGNTVVCPIGNEGKSAYLVNCADGLENAIADLSGLGNEIILLSWSEASPGGKFFRPSVEEVEASGRQVHVIFYDGTPLE